MVIKAIKDSSISFLQLGSGSRGSNPEGHGVVLGGETKKRFKGCLPEMEICFWMVGASLINGIVSLVYRVLAHELSQKRGGLNKFFQFFFIIQDKEWKE